MSVNCNRNRWETTELETGSGVSAELLGCLCRQYLNLVRSIRDPHAGPGGSADSGRDLIKTLTKTLSVGESSAEGCSGADSAGWSPSNTAEGHINSP